MIGSPSEVSPSFLQIKVAKQTMQIVGYEKNIAKKACTAAGFQYHEKVEQKPGLSQVKKKLLRTITVEVEEMKTVAPRNVRNNVVTA